MENLISSAEWQVMRVIWAHPGATSQEVIQSLEDGFDWQDSTIKTLLGRLRKKGYVRMEKGASKYQYLPLISEEQHLKQQLGMILDNMCSTKQGHLLMELLQAGSFSQADLAEADDYLQEKQRTAPDVVACHCLPGQCTCGQHNHARKEIS